MKQQVTFIGMFLLAYLCFLLAMIPANSVFSFVDLPKNIRLSEVKGTIWHSKVDAVSIDGVAINKITAKLNVGSLLLADPTLNVTFGDALISGPEGKLTVSGLLSTLKIYDAEVSVSAQLLADRLNVPIPLTAHHYIDIAVNDFETGAPICKRLAGSIEWPKASITALEQKVSLGDLAATFSCQQGDVVIAINENNDLGLSFTASVGGNGIASGEGYLRPKANTPEAINHVLPYLGRPDNQGRYRLRF